MHLSKINMMLLGGWCTCVVFLWGCGQATESSHAREITEVAVDRTRYARQRTLVLGSVSEVPSKEIKKHVMFMDYLAQALADHQVDHVRLVVAASIPEMVERFQKGEVDLYLDSPFPIVAVKRAVDGQLLLRRWRKGVAEYHSVIFARKDRGIDSIQALKGKMLAFEEPFSSSSYQLPTMFLEGTGLKLDEKRHASTPVGTDEVGYVFSQDDANTMAWVLRGKVDAGAMNMKAYASEAGTQVDQLHLLGETFAIPRHLVLARKGLDATLQEEIVRVLLEMEHTEEGRAVLADFSKTKRFDAIPQHFHDQLPEIEAFVAKIY